LLEKEKIIKLINCNENKGRKTEIKNYEAISEFIYFSLLAHSGFDFDNPQKSIVIQGSGIDIRINSNKSKSAMEKLISGDKEIFISHSEEFLNSLIAIYMASYFCFEFLYPNTYIVNLSKKKKTHELDIIGCVINNENKKRYIMVETTLGYFKKRNKDGNFAYDEDSHNMHFKKAIFKKWAIEKIFGIEVGLLYLSIRELSTVENGNEKDIFIEKILEKDRAIKVVSFFPKSNSIINIKLFSKEEYISNYNNLIDNFLNPVGKKTQELIESMTSSPH